MFLISTNSQETDVSTLQTNLKGLKDFLTSPLKALTYQSPGRVKTEKMRVMFSFLNSLLVPS